MTKKILSILLAIVMVLAISPVSAFAEDDILSYLTYEIIDGEVTITDCDDSISGDVVIPDTIEGYPVTTIENGAFSHCKSLVSVTIPESITSIDEGEFMPSYERVDGGLKIEGKLERITVAENNQYYSSDENGVLFDKEKTTLIHFPLNNTITEYTIPDSVTTIGLCAFIGCSNLEIIKIPESVTTIESQAFASCNNLKSIKIPYGVTTISVSAFYISGIENITIPESVKTIDVGAFAYCQNLTNVTIPAEVETIAEWAFAECSNLESIAILNPECSIYDDEFSIDSGATIYGYADSTAQAYAEKYERNFVEITEEDLVLSYLTYEINDGEVTITDCDESVSVEVVIPDTIEGYPVTAIGDYAFYSCNTLPGVTIPDGVTIIGNGAFGECSLLTKMTLPDSVKTIGEGAFDFCMLLEEINIPDSVTNIGAGAFCACHSLKSIDIPDSVTEITDSLFSSCYSLEEIIIPESVTSIGTEAFAACFCLKSISLPKNLEYLGSNAIFCLDPNFKDVYFYNKNIVFEEDSIYPFTVVYENVTNEEFVSLYIELFEMQIRGELTDEEEINQKFAEFDEIVGESIEIPADITVHGYKGGTAEAYADKAGFKFVPICDHLNTEIVNDSEADCENDGYTGDVYCNDCNEVITYGETIPATGHSYIENIITEPTYTQSGLMNTVCDKCGDVTAEVELPMLEIEDSEETEDKDTGVSVIFPDGAFVGEAEIEVTPVAEGDAFKLISHKQGNYKVTMFDINITVDGENVQPNGTVLVKIPLPKGYNQNKCVVYYVADDGSMEELKTYHYKDGYVYFETDHFSYYAILEDVETPAEDKDEKLNPLKIIFDKIIEYWGKIVAFMKSIFGLK